MKKLTQQQITSWVSRNFPNYKIASGGSQIRINNPFNGDDGFHFWISTEARPRKLPPHVVDYWVHDFRPGNSQYATSFTKFVSRFKNYSYNQALADICGNGKNKLSDILHQQRFVSKKDEEEDVKEDDEIALPALSKPISDNSYKTVREMMLNYLAGRKVTEERATELLLHYTPSTLVFPYYEYGILVYWQERSILQKVFRFPDEKKTGLGKTDFLYNFDNVEPDDYVGVVESIFNCISVGENCVASGGAMLGGKQILKLKSLSPKVIVLGPDNDDAGIKSLKKNFYLLRDVCKLAYCLPPDGIKDWNDLEKAEGEGAAKKYFDSNIHYLTLSSMMKLQSRCEK